MKEHEKSPAAQPGRAQEKGDDRARTAPFAPEAVGEVRKASLLTLQRSVGNRGTNMVLRNQTQVDPRETADNYKVDALNYFEENMRMELRNAAAVEGAAIGRRAGIAGADKVRSVCEPYERDLETDTNVLNTVFSITGGGQAVAEGFSSGPKPNEPASAGAKANIASRAVRAAQGMLNVWMPTLAGYRTVGSLKDAAVRLATETGAQGGETGSGDFAAYEREVLDELHKEWEREIDATHATIIRNSSPPELVNGIKRFWPAKRDDYLTKLRDEYGARSDVGASVVSAINATMEPRMRTLRNHLEEAKTSRQRWQAAGAIGGGIAGGAAIGAGIGAFAGGVGAVPGAIVGGIVGGVIGTVGAISILWD